MEFGAGFGAEDSAVPTDAPPHEEESDGATGEPPRLAIGIQGLLAPVRIAVSSADEEGRPPAHVQPPELPAEQLRQVRGRMESPPALGRREALWPATSSQRLHMPWLILALGLAVFLPSLLALPWPKGLPAQWPGVNEAFSTIQGLPAQANVIVYWAYDPSTAGELDLAALPVIEHLLQRRAKMSIVTLLPGGPATARRLIEQSRLEWQRSESLITVAESTWATPIQYLSGGPAALALVAQNPAQVFGDAVHAPPDLAVVFGAQAEDVQHWLEQAAPLSRAPVVAVVSAAADPVLRPYWDSGQLSGLVSGFDGASSYQSLLAERFPRLPRSPALDSQAVLQDWGVIVFLLAVVLGNLAAMFSHGPER